jgi:hypothetical protein
VAHSPALPVIGLTVDDGKHLEAQSADMHPSQFPCPCLLTALHAFFGGLGCVLLRYQGYLVLKPLRFHQIILMGGFSLLYTINITMSNISL